MRRVRDRRRSKKPEIWREGLTEQVQQAIVSFLGTLLPDVRLLVTESILEKGELALEEKETLARGFTLMDGDNAVEFIQALASMPNDHKKVMVFFISSLSKERVLDELLPLPAADLRLVAGELAALSRPERAAVLAAAEAFRLADLPPVLRRDLSKVHVCQPCRARREEEREFRLRYDLERAGDPQQDGWTAESERLFELRVPGVAAGAGGAPPAPASGEAELWYGRCRPVRVDTERMCGACREQAYAYVTSWGNGTELWHLRGTLGEDKGYAMREALEHRVWVAGVKRAWFRGERRAQRAAALQAAVQAGRRGAAARAELGRRRADREARDFEVAEEKRMYRQSVDDAVAEGMKYDKKWKDNVVNERNSLLRRKYLYAALQVERDFGTSNHHATAERLNPLSWHRKDTIGDGIPVTAFRAAQVFGAPVPEPENDLPDLQTWKKEGAATHKHLEMRRLANLRQLARSERMAAEAETEYWKGLAGDVEARVGQEAARQKYLREQRQRRRQHAREAAGQRRAALRREAERRRREEERLVQDSLGRKRLERQQEEEERRRMAAALAEQTVVDDFWGIPTEMERLRRLEEERRRLWQLRVDEQNKVLRHVKATRAPRGEPEPYFDFMDPRRAGQFANDFTPHPGPPPPRPPTGGGARR